MVYIRPQKVPACQHWLFLVITATITICHINLQVATDNKALLVPGVTTFYSIRFVTVTWFTNSKTRTCRCITLCLGFVNVNTTDFFFLFIIPTLQMEESKHSTFHNLYVTWSLGINGQLTSGLVNRCYLGNSLTLCRT